MSGCVTLCACLCVLLSFAPNSARSISSHYNVQQGSTRKTTLRVGVSFMCLLGITWGFGFLVVADIHVVFQYLFALLNSAQGLFLFYFHFWRNPDVKNLWKKVSSHRKVGNELNKKRNYHHIDVRSHNGLPESSGTANTLTFLAPPSASTDSSGGASSSTRDTKSTFLQQSSGASQVATSQDNSPTTRRRGIVEDEDILAPRPIAVVRNYGVTDKRLGDAQRLPQEDIPLALLMRRKWWCGVLWCGVVWCGVNQLW